jgi:hypothetical protein
MNGRPSSKRHVLIVAPESLEEAEAIGVSSRDAGVEVLVVAPALNSRLRHWVSDEDDARRAAESRLARCLERLDAVGIDAHGRVGDPDPLQAIADGLALFPADEIVISEHTEGESHRSTRDLVARARDRFELPVVHAFADAA